MQDAHCFHIVKLIKTDLHKRHLKGAGNLDLVVQLFYKGICMYSFVYFRPFLAYSLTVIFTYIVCLAHIQTLTDPLL